MIPLPLLRLPSELVHLYAAIRSFDWEKRGRGRKGCTAKVETLAEIIGVGERAAQRYLRKLEACGAIRIESRPHLPNLILCTPESFDPSRVSRGTPRTSGHPVPADGVRVNGGDAKGERRDGVRVSAGAPEVDTFKQIQEVETVAGGPASSPAPLVLAAQVKPARKRQKAPPGLTSATWDAYAAAYAERYDGHIPARNARVSGQLGRLLERIPACDAPAVAAFYVQHASAFYTTRAHPVGLLLADAEKLHMEWATGRRVNAHTARQNEQTAGNAAWAYAKELEEREQRKP